MFIDKSLCLCGFLMATEFMQHFDKKLSSTKGFWAWGKNRGQKMQGYFLNARLQNVQQCSLQGVAAGGCVQYPVIVGTRIYLQIPPDRK